MKLIPLTQGQFAKVDDEDFEYLNQFKWMILKSGNGFYARRNSKRINGKRKSILMHCEILKTPKGFLTDHINQDKLDNQKRNLRIATASENKMNVGSRKNTSSKYKGVYLHKKDKWKAYISINKKQKYIGLFKTEENAATAYNIFAEKHHGEFANYNKAL